MSAETGGANGGGPHRFGLKQTLMALLAAALLPAGGLAVGQSYKSFLEAKEVRDRALAQELSDAVAPARDLILSARGILRFAAAEAAGLAEAPEECATRMQQIVAAKVNFLAARYSAANGDGCDAGEVDGPFANGERAILAAFEQQPRSTLRVALTPDRSREIVLVAEPVLVGGAYVGALSVGIAVKSLDQLAKAADVSPNQRVALFGPSAALLAVDIGEARSWLPEPTKVKQLIDSAPQRLHAISRGGEAFVYASDNVVGGDLVAVAAWPENEVSFDLQLSAFLGVVLPLAAWGLALTVVYFTTDRLVLRHLRRLSSLAHELRRGRLEARSDLTGGAPRELLELGEQFDSMASRIAEREARLLQAVEDERLLMREVHHRVKNNLQLIVSLLNLQAQDAASDDEIAAIRRTQDRVQSLAMVHQNLYQVGRLSEARLDLILEQVIASLRDIRGDEYGGVELKLDLDEVRLDADRAVAASFLATEAVINAFKHCDLKQDRAWIVVELRRREDGAFSMTVTNNYSDEASETAPGEASGLGEKLMRGFARQLRAELTKHRADDRYQLRVDAPPPSPRENNADAERPSDANAATVRPAAATVSHAPLETD